jgi:uncharacterized protein (DUF302 family)
MSNANDVDGLISTPSHFGVGETVDRLESAVRAKGLTVFVRIDHAAGARAVGLALRPTELLVFGNARGGTPLMQRAPTIGIDLPLKALAWEDENEQVWLSYQEPGWLAARHHVGVAAEEATAKLAAVLADVARTAVAP